MLDKKALVPATGPIARFDPTLVRWHCSKLEKAGESEWAIEALHLNRGRRLYITDLSWLMQTRWNAKYRDRRQGAEGEGGGGGGGGGDGDGDSSGTIDGGSTGGSGSGSGTGGAKRSRDGKWLGLHMHRTCKYLERKGLVAWPDDDGNNGGGSNDGGEGGEGAAGASVEALLPGGGVLRSVRGMRTAYGSETAEMAAAAAATAAAKAAAAHDGGNSGDKGGAGRRRRKRAICGRPPTKLLPRLTSAGRMVWMMQRLGLKSSEAIVLALMLGREMAAGYFVKSKNLVHENVWLTDNQIHKAFLGLGKKGYVEMHRQNGQVLHVRRARRIEPYAPMLAVIETMVYEARAGEYVYGDTYDEQIDEAYAETVAALKEDCGGGGGGGQ